MVAARRRAARPAILAGLALTASALAGCAGDAGEAPAPTTFEGVLAEATERGYWALDRLEDGEVTFDELEWAHDQWEGCVNQIGYNVIALDSWRSPVDGTLGGLWYDWNGQEPAPDQDDPVLGEKIEACFADFDLELLSLAYSVGHEQVMDEPLRQYTLECLGEADLKPDPSDQSVPDLMADPGVGEGAFYLVEACVTKGVEELYPEVLQVSVGY
ncbi:MAG: hypothetical protein LBS27_01895 [Bifidobacteriaceae bacterium]|jgi:hypothetical protein|nr:hypothetical protein [Bifidobacteriaceae bacterium]